MIRGCALIVALALAQPALTQPALAQEQPDPVGTDQPPGSAEPPPMAHTRAADRYWDAAAMDRAERAMMAQASFGAVRLDLAEYRLGTGKSGDGYGWEGEGWIGDRDRALLRARGDGSVQGGLERAEVEVGWSHALDPWWNLQLGVRQDIRPTPARTRAMVAIEGMAPYRFDVLAALYLSDKGEATARAEVSLDQRLTRRIVLQPRIEADLAAQDSPAQRQGAGLVNAEAGLRLRYEITRRFAPYLGLTWNWATGRTATWRRADGESPTAHALVMGIRTRF